MQLVRVDGDDDVALQALADLQEAVRAHDDPGAFPVSVEDVRNEVRYGGDLNPGRFSLLADDDGQSVGVLAADAPVHDNRHLLWATIEVHPDHRRRGHGSRLMEALLELAADLGRTTLWVGAAADDSEDSVGAHAFLAGHGFAPASRDARRQQVLADVDLDELASHERDAAQHSGDYALERLLPPYDDATLATLSTVTAAINDAPMGSLAYEDEVFDVDRLRDVERAVELRGERVRRVVARHRVSGEVAGHSCTHVKPWDPTHAIQYDTAVSREHRGHRLGLALKIAMMRWLADEEPQLEVVETWNNVENDPMINVNEAIGYRLSREFAMHQRQL